MVSVNSEMFEVMMKMVFVQYCKRIMYVTLFVCSGLLQCSNDFKQQFAQTQKSLNVTKKTHKNLRVQLVKNVAHNNKVTNSSAKTVLQEQKQTNDVANDALKYLEKMMQELANQQQKLDDQETEIEFALQNGDAGFSTFEIVLEEMQKS